MTNIVERNAIFISHATPDDNAFVRWLGAKLTALGYEVWADVMRLRGGSDWSRELENALNFRAAKMLLVCTPSGLDKQGVRNEIEIATTLAKQLGDHEFIIPLRLEPYNPVFRIAHAQYVDFVDGWANGFTELAELLSQFSALHKTPGRSMEAWLNAQSEGASKLSEKREYLVSNWLTLRGIPRDIFYCEPPDGFQVERFQQRSLHTWPSVPFWRGVVTFASPNDQEMLNSTLPAKIAREIHSEKFLEEGWKDMGIAPHSAQKIFSDLGNQAIEMYFHQKNLSFSEGSSGRRWWFGNIKTVPLKEIRFNWKHRKGRRQIIGQSGKRGVFWHYAMSGQVRMSPVRHVRLSASLVFSNNGMDTLSDPKKSHNLRRSFAKSWRNARWRDMMSAYLWWISNGKDELEIPIAEGHNLVLTLPPTSFASKIGVIHKGEAPSDEDDPDIVEDDFDDFPDEMPEGDQDK